MESNDALKFNENEEIEAFAKLEGIDLKKFIQKTHVIIGREKPDDMDPSIQFIQLDNEAKISRQHIEIRYNYDKEHWELKNLSKNKVYLNLKSIRNYDGFVVLTPHSAITISSMNFYFFPAVQVS